MVLIGIRMPGVDEIEATRRIVAAGGRSRILVLTTFDVDRYALAALRAGASGFLLKNTRPEELLAGIRAVAAGDAVIAPALTRRLLDEFADRLGDDLCVPVREDPRLGFLTSREREILVAIGHGLTNGEIAQRFHAVGIDGEDPRRAASPRSAHETRATAALGDGRPGEVVLH